MIDVFAINSSISKIIDFLTYKDNLSEKTNINLSFPNINVSK